MCSDTTTKQLATVSGDGFEDTDATDRLIQGTILKSIDGFWSTKDGTTFPPGTKMIALATTTCVQHWQDQTPVETIIKQPGVPLPDVDELNSRIPEKEWERGLDGNPRAPYVKEWVAYLLDPRDASIYTFINSTRGAEIAVEKLQSRVKWMRALRGDKVVPVVELSSKPMKTQFGLKQRPEFKIDGEWRELGTLAPAQDMPSIEHIGTPTLQEEMADAVPFNDPLPTDLSAQKKKKK